MKQNNRQKRFFESKWRCVSGCGACCNLDPAERPDLAEYLSEDELATYMSMVGADGWCMNYDHDNRKCQIYEQRPRFCRVQPDTFQSMFGVAATDFNEFALACCQQQITGVYGAPSPELEHYEQEITSG